MRRSPFVLSLSLLSLLAVPALTSTAGGCNGDDTVAPNPRSSGADATTDGAGNGEGGGSTVSALCAKYGGQSGVENIVRAVIASVTADCRIGAYFTGFAETDKVHFQDCLSRQVGEFMKCGVTYAGSSDTLGAACRSMAEAHQNLNAQITSDDFDAFMLDVTSTLKAQGMSTDDVATIAPSFLSTRGDVVQSGDQGPSQSTCNPQVDGGQDAPGDTGADADDGAIADADDAG